MRTQVVANKAELAHLGELIDSIYQGATDPTHWNSARPAIAEWINAPKGLLFTPFHTPNNGGFYFNHRIPEQVMQMWSTRWQGEDIMANTAVERGLFVDGRVVRGEDVVPFEKMQQAPIYRELNHPNGIDHFLFSIIFGLSSPSEMPTVMNFYRSIREGTFLPDEQQRLQIILPHVSRALAVMKRLRNMELKTAASLAALDRLNAGVVLFDTRGAVSFANKAARRILELEDGLKLRHLVNNTHLGELVTEDHESQEALEAAILGAVSPDYLQMTHFSQAVTISRPSGRQAYTLNFSSLAAHNEFGSGVDAPRAIAFITDSSESIRLDSMLMRKTYGLTAAEIRVAEMLAECLTVDETAKRLNLSRSTIKAHQQSIYEKTNTNSRAKLMRLLMSLVQVVE